LRGGQTGGRAHGRAQRSRRTCGDGRVGRAAAACRVAADAGGAPRTRPGVGTGGGGRASTPAYLTTELSGTTRDGLGDTVIAVGEAQQSSIPIVRLILNWRTTVESNAISFGVAEIALVIFSRTTKHT